MAAQQFRLRVLWLLLCLLAVGPVSGGEQHGTLVGTVVKASAPSETVPFIGVTITPGRTGRKIPKDADKEGKFNHPVMAGEYKLRVNGKDREGRFWVGNNHLLNLAK